MHKQSKPIPEAVKAFNDLPSDARVPAEVVAYLFSISGRTLNRRVQAGLIPAPVHSSPRAFNVGEIRRALGLPSMRETFHAPVASRFTESVSINAAALRELIEDHQRQSDEISKLREALKDVEMRYELLSDSIAHDSR
jgi:hypothetical protein